MWDIDIYVYMRIICIAICIVALTEINWIYGGDHTIRFIYITALITIRINAFDIILLLQNIQVFILTYWDSLFKVFVVLVIVALGYFLRYIVRNFWIYATLFQQKNWWSSELRKNRWLICGWEVTIYELFYFKVEHL